MALKWLPIESFIAKLHVAYGESRGYFTVFDNLTQRVPQGSTFGPLLLSKDTMSYFVDVCKSLVFSNSNDGFMS